jgi:thioredoxin reductase (NADPH)
MKRRVEEKENIEILYNCNTKSLSGEDGLEAATLVRYAGTPEEEVFTIDIDGFFLGIGHNPNTKLFAQWVELDELGYVKVAPYTSETNVKGVFAAGDVCDPRYRQAITAAGSGCKAALDAERFLANQ